jgi:HAD superfamily hydrolase (TIGR01509 family)
MIQKNSQYAVLWDLDGTMIDTGEPHYITWRDTLAEIGIAYTREDFQKTFGMNNSGVMEYVFGEKPDHDLGVSLASKKEELFREIIRKGVEPLPGIMDWLTRFQQWGLKQAVASSAPWANIDVQIDGIGVRPYFDVIVSGAELPPKPNPDVFLKAASELGVLPENCVVFEDAVAGLRGAVAAGMKCITVTTTNPPEKLTAANLVYKNLAEMTEEAFLDLIGWRL